MNKEYISSNIRYLIKRENLGKDTFGKIFDLNRGAISSYIDRKSKPKIETLLKISKKYRLTLDDLVTKDLSKGISNTNQETTCKIPFYDISSAEKDNHKTDMTDKAKLVQTIDIGDILRDSESAMRIYDDSMMPNYPPSCVVGMRQIHDNFIEPGTVYVIETRSDRYIKRLYNTKEIEGIKCYSDNTMKFANGSNENKYIHEPFTIPWSEIISLHRVVGVIKREIN